MGKKSWHDQYDENGKRMTAHKRGYNRKWQKARKEHLASNPYCVHCLEVGKYVPAEEVDHIIPHDGNKQLFWEQSNWQSLCHSCHSSKTAKEVADRGNLFQRIPSFFVYWGPSGSGKSTAAKKAAGRDDLVIDFDALFKALNPMLKKYERLPCLYPFVLQAIDAIVDRATRKSRVRNVYYLTAIGSWDKVKGILEKTKGKLVIFDEEESVCESRCLCDHERIIVKQVDWLKGIKEWKKEYCLNKEEIRIWESRK